MVSTTLWYVCTNGSDQMSIQRFLSTRDASAARRTLFVSQVTDVTVMMLLGLTGIAVLGFYRVHSPELAAGQTLHSMGDRLFPMFIMAQMPAGLSGLVLAAILSAASSSLSSGVNSACAVLEKDFLSSRTGSSSSDAETVSRLKWLTWLVSTSPEVPSFNRVPSGPRFAGNRGALPTRLNDIMPNDFCRGAYLPSPSG